MSTSEVGARVGKVATVIGGTLVVGGVGGVLAAIFAKHLPLLRGLDSAGSRLLGHGSAGIAAVGSQALAVGLGFGIRKRSSDVAKVPQDLRTQGTRVDRISDADLELLEEEEEDWVCPITLAVPRDAAVLCQEGKGYSADAITEYFQGRCEGQKKIGPVSGEIIPSPTIVENRAVRDFLEKGLSLTDPLTGAKFGRAYICLQTGYTYNIESLQECVEARRQAGEPFVCPASGIVCHRLTLYPNYTLWDRSNKGIKKDLAGKAVDEKL